MVDPPAPRPPKPNDKCPPDDTDCIDEERMVMLIYILGIVALVAVIVASILGFLLLVVFCTKNGWKILKANNERSIQITTDTLPIFNQIPQQDKLSGLKYTLV